MGSQEEQSLHRLSQDLVRLTAQAQQADAQLSHQISVNADTMNKNFQQFSVALTKIIATLGPLVEELLRLNLVKEEVVPKLGLEIKRTVTKGEVGQKVLGADGKAVV